METNGKGRLRGTLAETGALIWGAARHPLRTYEKMAHTPSPRGALVFLGTLAVVAGAINAALAWGAAGAPGGGGTSPAAAAAVGFGLGGLVAVFGVYLAASAVIWGVARALGSQATFKAVLTAWAGSYVPTAAWFGGLLAFHGLFDPPGAVDPASLSSAGPAIVQGLFMTFSLAAFLWKALLLYLTLRVVGKLDFTRIAMAAVVLAPVAVGYWIIGLSLGWFKVPFI